MRKSKKCKQNVKQKVQLDIVEDVGIMIRKKRKVVGSRLYLVGYVERMIEERLRNIAQENEHSFSCVPLLSASSLCVIFSNMPSWYLSVRLSSDTSDSCSRSRSTSEFSLQYHRERNNGRVNIVEGTYFKATQTCLDAKLSRQFPITATIVMFCSSKDDDTVIVKLVFLHIIL